MKKVKRTGRERRLRLKRDKARTDEYNTKIEGPGKEEECQMNLRPPASWSSYSSHLK